MDRRSRFLGFPRSLLRESTCLRSPGSADVPGGPANEKANEKAVILHKLQQEKGKLAAGILADADISKKLNPEMVRALLDG